MRRNKPSFEDALLDWKQEHKALAGPLRCVWTRVRVFLASRPRHWWFCLGALLGLLGLFGVAVWLGIH